MDTPTDSLSWFLRDVDGHFSSKRLLAYFFAILFVIGMFIGTPLDIMTLIFLACTGFGGLSTIERWQPK